MDSSSIAISSAPFSPSLLSLLSIRAKAFAVKGFFVLENPALGVGFKRAFSDEDDINTPFDIMKLRSANCNIKSKGGHSI